MSLVSLVPVYANSTSNAIERAFDLINFKFRDEVKNIIIKPNMCYYSHCSTGHTTDPAFIGALIELLRQKFNAETRISIIESDASAMKCKHVFKFLGYDKLSKKFDVTLLNLSEEKSDLVHVEIGNYKFPLLIPRIIQNADLRINVPKLKYSKKELGITCAMKNIYGCNSYPKKYKYHPRLSEAIVAINKAIPFSLCLLDGNIVIGARTTKLGLVMASQDPVAFDAAAARIAGLSPNKIKFLNLAAKERLGGVAFVERGAPIAYFRSRYPKPSTKMALKGAALRLLIKTRVGRWLGL